MFGPWSSFLQHSCISEKNSISSRVIIVNSVTILLLPFSLLIWQRSLIACKMNSEVSRAIEIGCKCNFQVLQGSTETYLRWDGESLWRMWRWNNFINRCTFAEVMIKSQAYSQVIFLHYGTLWNLTITIAANFNGILRSKPPTSIA